MAARIGVTGPKGRLGGELVRRGCVPLCCDVTDPAWLQEALAQAAPDVVVHCAAMTEVDACERQAGRAVRINALGTGNLAQAFDGPIVYMSTDYIFDGRDGPYDEDAPANPISVYGWSKLGGELAIRQRRNPKDLVVRTTVLFDCYSMNFVISVARKLLAGERLTLPMNLVGSPTYVPDLAHGILAAIEKDVSGVVNLAGAHVISRYEMGCYVAHCLGYDASVYISGGAPTGDAPRPLKAGLKVDKARALGLPIGNPQDGMREVARYALETMEAR